MPKAIARLFLFLLTLLILAIAAVWIVLAAPAFSQMRRDLLEDVLQSQIGQPVAIDRDVRVVLGPVSRIHASGVRIPSETMADVNLAELKLLEIDLDLFALARGEVDLNNLVVDGLKVRLLGDEDGTKSWSDPPETAQEGTAAPQGGRDAGIVFFLKDRNFRFTDVGLDIVDGKSGFEFLFDLAALDLGRDPATGRPALSGHGTLNGKDVTVNGSFPGDALFGLAADIAGVAVTYDGQTRQTASGPDHTAALTIEIGSMGDLLDILKLERVAEGSGRLTTDVEFDGKTLKLSNFSTTANLENGAHAEIKGSVADLLGATGIDLATRVRLFPDDRPPPAATSLKDLELTGLSAGIVGDATGFRIDDLEVTTNAFDPELKSVGPLSIRRLIRTPDGHLAMRGIGLRIGPQTAPYLEARGDIADLLALKGLRLEGNGTLPAELALSRAVRNPAPFGQLVAEFAADDSAGHLGLSKLVARAENTDLWTADLNMHVSNVAALDDVGIVIDLGFPKVERALEALGADPVAKGPLSLHAALRGKGSDFETVLGLDAAKSDLNAEWRTQLNDRAPRLSGRIYSDLIDMQEIATEIDAAMDLVALFGDTAEPSPAPASLQPLVLPAEPADAGRGASQGLQPLVLPEPGPGRADLPGTAPPTSPERQAASNDTKDSPEAARSDLQPLVLPTSEPDLKDLLDLPRLLRSADAHIAIELARISGQQGISSVNSDLTVKAGQAALGPVRLAYGGGHAAVTAGLNFIDSPDWITLSGSTGGWDFGKILDAVGAGIPAYGILNGSFDVTGRHTSLRAFLGSMSGRAHVSLRNGKIGTSLLELAGLGILPWLFSKELAEGYTRIVCIEAPLHLRSGRIESNAIVLETNSVQVVARGYVDLKRETIALRAEPRPVGRADARSAWPVEVTGALRKPKIDLKPGAPGVRLPRLEGAEAAARRVPCRPDAKQGR